MNEHSFYKGTVFEMAHRQFVSVADHLQIPVEERERIFLPKRAIAVSCPIHRDDGSTIEPSTMSGSRNEINEARRPISGELVLNVPSHARPRWPGANLPTRL